MFKKSERKRISDMEAELKRQADVITDLQDKDESLLVHVKFVGIEFDRDLYKSGESELNCLLKSGYRVIRDHQTGSGIVVTLGLYKPANVVPTALKTERLDPSYIQYSRR